MSGASPLHVQITTNVTIHLGWHLRGRSCRLFNGDVKIRVVDSGLYTYPDAAVVCGEPRFDADPTAILLNPTVIVEVLSPSTEGYDRGRKFEHYGKIPSLREYLLLAQDSVRAERFERDGERWVLTTFDGPDAVIGLPSVGVSLRLADVYEGVELPPHPPLRAVHEEAPQYAVSPSA
jgi:Uma2 family endonuclease